MITMSKRPNILIINPDEMRGYGKEASNQKQEIDRQYHTIPN
jgi:hypothetical protein